MLLLNKYAYFAILKKKIKQFKNSETMKSETQELSLTDLIIKAEEQERYIDLLEEKLVASNKVLPFLPEDYGFERYAEADTEEMKCYALPGKDGILIYKSRKEPDHHVLYQPDILNAHVRIHDDRSAGILFTCLDMPVHYGKNAEVMDRALEAAKEKEEAGDAN